MRAAHVSTSTDSLWRKKKSASQNLKHWSQVSRGFKLKLCSHTFPTTSCQCYLFGTGYEGYSEVTNAHTCEPFKMTGWLVNVLSTLDVGVGEVLDTDSIIRKCHMMRSCISPTKNEIFHVHPPLWSCCYLPNILQHHCGKWMNFPPCKCTEIWDVGL